MKTKPRLTVGLPVYNGERYLAECLDSILSQSFSDFELLICDNASTDATAAICRERASSDARIRYHRNPVNLGAIPNFNLVLKMSQAELFKWAAHDDLLRPTYLEKCVSLLDANPNAVLCHSLVRIIDETGQVLEAVAPMEFEAGSPSPAARFGARMRSPRCVEVFGVIRREVAASVGMEQSSYIGGDRVFLAELALLGRFGQVPEPLFLNRDHPRRSVRITRSAPRKDLAAWYDATKASGSACPTWMAHRDYLRQIRRHVPGLAERLRCYGHIVASLRRRRTAAFLALEPFAAFDPRVLSWAKALDRRLARAGLVHSRQA